MDHVHHPPGNKPRPVKSKYKNISDPPKQKIKQPAPQIHRRTFGTIRDPNVPQKKPPQNPKQPKTIQPVTKTESANNNAVAFPENVEGSASKKSPVSEVKTPVRPPFTVKPFGVSETPYLSAEKCSSCRFDRLETASYWLGQIKSAETVGKHFVSAEFFRLARDCKAEPARNLFIELKKYLARHEDLSTKTEWERVSRDYGI
ncbi:hypothetical protein QVD17_36435 [Tagetes erecta]|uniref:Uncharacterized protein n=1 Tax=Tagetes erecta TaxID=13708 RepID=A0AAD8NJ04_TARER|nr:hypothetical protein QVD17_36435 [Tagetes erecta]